MKGSSAVIATILMLIITIGLAVTAYIYISRLMDMQDELKIPTELCRYRDKQYECYEWSDLDYAETFTTAELKTLQTFGNAGYLENVTYIDLVLGNYTGYIKIYSPNVDGGEKPVTMDFTCVKFVEVCEI